VKRAVIILFLLALSVYSVPEINYVSPYINSGASMYFSAYHNPLIIKYAYRANAWGDRYPAFANDVYFTQRIMRQGGVSIGTKDEKNEVWFSYALFFPWRFRFRHKANAFELGDDRLFRNVSISPFYGISMAYYARNSLFDHVNRQRSNGYIQTYFGTALGTRKNFARFSYFEIFTSPNISRTYYGALGGGRNYNPMHEINPNRTVPNFSASFWDFAMPAGVGFKHRIFLFRNGMAVAHTFGGEERRIRSGNLTVDSYNFPNVIFFSEMGIHFRRFRMREKVENSQRRENEAMNE